MFYLRDEDPVKFAAKHGLEMQEWKCKKCGEVFRYEVPFVFTEMWGLATPVHECGPGYTSAMMTPRTDEDKQFWNSLLG